MSAVARSFPNTIISLKSKYDLSRFTCLVHALDFTEKPAYLKVASMRGINVFAGKDFAVWLLNTNSLTVLISPSAAERSIVIYFDDAGSFAHIGIVTSSGRVQSKWGTLGLYEHGLYEVPLEYGSNVKYFAQLAYVDGIRLFHQFAVSLGANLSQK